MLAVGGRISLDYGNVIYLYVSSFVLENADQQERMALIRELAILIHVGRHPNIVSLVGACTFEGNESLSIVESPLATRLKLYTYVSIL